MKVIAIPGTNQTGRFGRREPLVRIPHFSLGRYLAKRRLAAPPASCTYAPKAVQSLSNIFLNDAEGNCVIAGGYHVEGIETGNAGVIFIPTTAQLNDDYGAIGGYVPGDPSTDNGCDEQTALNFWTQHGFANGTKLLGWLEVDATNPDEVKQAMYLFENLFFGVALPDAWVSPFPNGNGFVWDVAGSSDPENGHCFVGTGYDSVGVNVDTWGMLGTLTWRAVAAYAIAKSGGALYVMLSPDQVARGAAKAPNGIDWATLIADFDALGGNVAPPSPSPAPTPVPVVPPAPVPTTGVTLAQATQWALSGLSGRGRMIHTAAAERAVSSALTNHWPKK